jgi:hypothetical protein
VTDPKFGICIKSRNKEVQTIELLQSLPGFTEEGAFLYFTVEASQPEPLRAAFVEFLNTGLSLVKEMDPQIGGALGDLVFEVGTSGNHVVVGFDMMKCPMTSQVVELLQLCKMTTVRNELKSSFGLTFDKTFTELLTATAADFSSLKGNFHFTTISSVGDKFKIKNAYWTIIEELMRQEGIIEYPKAKKLWKLVTFMFHSFSFKLHSIELGPIVEELNDQVGYPKRQFN